MESGAPHRGAEHMHLTGESEKLNKDGGQGEQLYAQLLLHSNKVNMELFYSFPSSMLSGVSIPQG